MHAQRNFGLDLARAVAISMVFLSHGVTALETLGVGVDSVFRSLRIPDRPHLPAFPSRRARAQRLLHTLELLVRALVSHAAALLRRAGSFRFCRVALPQQPHPPLLSDLPAELRRHGRFWPLVEPCASKSTSTLRFPCSASSACASAANICYGCCPCCRWCLRCCAIRCRCHPNWYWRTHLHAEGLVLGVWLAYLFVDRKALWHDLRLPALPIAILPLALLAYQFNPSSAADALSEERLSALCDRLQRLAAALLRSALDAGKPADTAHKAGDRRPGAGVVQHLPAAHNCCSPTFASCSRAWRAARSNRRSSSPRPSR